MQCAGPGRNGGRCEREASVSELCLAHYRQRHRYQVLAPLRGPRGTLSASLVGLTAQVPEDDREQMEQLAHERGVSLAQVVREVLATGLNGVQLPERYRVILARDAEDRGISMSQVLEETLERGLA